MQNYKQTGEELDRYNITREKVIDMLYEDREMAKVEGKASVCLSVTKLFGDSIGMFNKADDRNIPVMVAKFSEADRAAIEMIYGKHNKVHNVEK